MSKYIVDIHGEIEGDYEIVGKYEEQEPTTKNDLGVDCISRQAVIDLMMQKWGENFSGDDAMQESMDDIRALPSVTLQESILDKIRAQYKSHLRGVEITLEVLVENDPLRPKFEGAKETGYINFHVF